MRGKDGLDFKVVNIVANGDMGREIDIEALNEGLGDRARPNEEQPGIAVRISESWEEHDNGEDSPPLTTFFRSGKYIIRGKIENLEKLKEKHEKVLEILENMDGGEELVNDEIKDGLEVSNIVAVGHIGEEVNLESLTIALGVENVSYQPETFPSLVYSSSVSDYSCTFSVFASGKTVITGSKDEPEEIKKEFEKFVENEIKQVTNPMWD